MEDDNDGSWTPDVEVLLRQWHARMWATGQIHRHRAFMLSCVSKLLTLPKIMFGVTGSLLLAYKQSAVHYISDRDAARIDITAAVLVALLTALAGLNESFSPSIHCDRHTQAALRYILLCEQIDAQLMLPRHDRIPATPFVRDLYTQRVTLLQNEPSISLSTVPTC